MSIAASQLLKVAKLARLQLSEAEQNSLGKELNQILQWVEQLGEVDTDQAPPMSGSRNMRLHWRADEVTDGNCADAILANAPEAKEGFFVVPKVVE